MLAAVRKKLMLGVIIDACLQRQIEQRKARPECNPARAAHLYMAGAAQIERAGGNEIIGNTMDGSHGIKNCSSDMANMEKVNAAGRADANAIIADSSSAVSQ